MSERGLSSAPTPSSSLGVVVVVVAGSPPSTGSIAGVEDRDPGVRSEEEYSILLLLLPNTEGEDTLLDPRLVPYTDEDSENVGRWRLYGVLGVPV